MNEKVERPWGWYMNVYGDDYNGYKIKVISVKPGHRLSLQSHKFRSEHWVIVRGFAKVQVGTSIFSLQENDNIFIPKESLHRIENIGTDDLEFTETQIGEYLGEEDIIRFEDDYARV